MDISSEGNVSISSRSKQTWLLVISVAFLSSFATLFASYFGFLSASRASDVDAAELAIALIDAAEPGKSGSIQRRFGINLLQKSTGIYLSEAEFVAWIDGDFVLASSTLQTVLARDGILTLSEALIQPCKSPVDLPTSSNGLNDQDIEIFWGQDRSALTECRERFAVLSSLLSAQK